MTLCSPVSMVKDAMESVYIPTCCDDRKWTDSWGGGILAPPDETLIRSDDQWVQTNCCTRVHLLLHRQAMNEYLVASSLLCNKGDIIVCSSLIPRPLIQCMYHYWKRSTLGLVWVWDRDYIFSCYLYVSSTMNRISGMALQRLHGSYSKHIVLANLESEKYNSRIQPEWEPECLTEGLGSNPSPQSYCDQSQDVDSCLWPLTWTDFENCMIYK